jgi:hypothetical protein
MRFAWVAVVAAVVMAGGCAAEKQRVEKEDRLSAARLDGKFRHDDPLVQMLSPREREAMQRVGMLADPPELAEGEVDEDGDGIADVPVEEPSKMDQAGDVMMSVLSVGLTLGMMAAPYLLF